MKISNELYSTRQSCCCWEEDLEWCSEDFPAKCLFSKECKVEAIDE